MRRVLEIGLSLAVALAVLGFGGTAPQFFAITQVIVLFLGILRLFAGRSFSATRAHFPVTVSFLLVALVLLQIVPLPISVAHMFGVSVVDPPGHTTFTISAAPYETVSQMLALVTYLTAFYLVLTICTDQGSKKRLVLALLAIGVFEAFYGLIQYLTGWQQIFFYMKKFYLEDATGTYINRNHFAGLLEMILPFAVVFALQHVWRLRQRFEAEHAPARKLLSSSEFPFLVFWIFISAAIFAAIVGSHSRMGILSTLASLVVVLTLAGTSMLSAKVRVAVGVVFLLSMVGLAVWVGSDPAITRFETLNDQYAHPGQDRLSIWRDTLQLIRRHPVLGSGFGSFATVYPSVQTAFLNNVVDHAHCDYLELTTELGLPGGIVVFGGIFWVLGSTFRRCKKAGVDYDKAVSLACSGSIVAILLHSLADFNLYIPANALIFVMILALAWSSSGQMQTQRPSA
ncbi:MAG TPA: O-antigen ligase family protein [Candidatus Bathyarchaeia archaeon]|nr:O-antigen ligase family protein [Candidatus Bathyarchaeia archaeon]